MAKLNGATEDEIREAVAVGGLVRHWSTFLNGAQIDLSNFQTDVDEVLKAAAAAAKK